MCTSKGSVQRAPTGDMLLCAACLHNLTPLGKGGERAPYQLVHTRGLDLPATPHGNQLLGRKVEKKFGCQKYSGVIKSYDAAKRWYQVHYDDSDEEELDEAEIRDVLVPLAKPKRYVPTPAAPAGVVVVERPQARPHIQPSAIDGLINCPNCGTGLSIAPRGCSLHMCVRCYHYLCCHCGSDCGVGEQHWYCRTCPYENNKETRALVARQQQNQTRRAKQHHTI